MADYTKIPRPQLQRLAANGDEAAARELGRRKAEPRESAGPLDPPPRRVLRAFERPLTSPRYQWWPPYCDQPSYDAYIRGRDYWREQDRAAREAAEKRRT